MCVHVCICVCSHVWISVRMCECINAFTYLSTCMYVRICRCVRTHRFTTCMSHCHFRSPSKLNPTITFPIFHFYFPQGVSRAQVPHRGVSEGTWVQDWNDWWRCQWRSCLEESRCRCSSARRYMAVRLRTVMTWNDISSLLHRHMRSDTDVDVDTMMNYF